MQGTLHAIDARLAHRIIAIFPRTNKRDGRVEAASARGQWNHGRRRHVGLCHIPVFKGTIFFFRIVEEKNIVVQITVQINKLTLKFMALSSAKESVNETADKPCRKIKNCDPKDYMKCIRTETDKHNFTETCMIAQPLGDMHWDEERGDWIIQRRLKKIDAAVKEIEQRDEPVRL